MEQQPTSPHEWFNQVNITPPPSQKRSKRKRIIIITLLIMLSLLATSIILILTASKKNITAPPDNNTAIIECFEPTTYNHLLRIINDKTEESLTLADAISSETFYVYDVYFESDSTNFNLNATTNPTDFLGAIAAYHKENHKNVPFSVQLESYYTNDNTDITSRRIDAVKQILINAGMSETAIKVVPIEKPAARPTEGITLEEAEDNEEITDYDIDGVPVTVSIIPISTKVCSE